MSVLWEQKKTARIIELEQQLSAILPLAEAQAGMGECTLRNAEMVARVQAARRALQEEL